MFKGYVCEADRGKLRYENVISTLEVGKGDPDPISDAPMTCIFCGKETTDIFVTLVDF